MNPVGIVIGLMAWFVVRCLISGIYTVNQSERAVKTSFGRAERIPGASTLNDPISASLDADEKQRYAYPQVRVIVPGGPYFKWPWEKVYKVSVATQTINMAYDPRSPAPTRAARCGGGHQGPVQHRPDGPDSLPHLRAQSLRLSVRREEPDRARDGLFCFRVARAHRQL